MCGFAYRVYKLILLHSLTFKLLYEISHLHLDLMKTVFNNLNLEVPKRKKTARKMASLKINLAITNEIDTLKKENGIFLKVQGSTKLLHKL